MASPWEQFGRNLATAPGAFAEGETRMGQALAAELQAQIAARKAEADMAESRRRAQFQTPEFGSKIAGVLAGFTEPQTAQVDQFMQRGDWGPDNRFGPPAPGEMAPAPDFATPQALQRFQQGRAAQFMSLAGKGDSNADHMAQALARLVGTNREDDALAGRITPESAQGLNALEAARGGKLFSANEAMVVNQATGKPEFNPYYVSGKQANEGLVAAQAQAARAKAEESRAEARLKNSKVIIGPDGQPTGARPKMTAAQEKETFEADDLVNAGQNASAMLREALKLNDQAYSGFGAKTRAIVRSNLPGKTPEADATVNLDNLMTGQALESLKATFGAAPTEGERKILMDLQASADKTPEQRRDILTRAIGLTERRVEVNRAKAKALREGSYLSPSYQAPERAEAPPKLSAEDKRASVLKARKAIDSGKDKAEVIRRLEAAGITDHGIK